MLELLDEFVRICETNNLSYFLTAGTLLGAARHKGFIPWDDDIDVAMPRKDYELFLDLLEKSNNKIYYVLSCRSPKKSIYHYEPYAKLCKKGTVFAESARNPGDYSGIFIDIWPFDKCILLFVPLQTMLIKSVWKLYRLINHIDIPQKKSKRFITKLLCCIFSSKFCNTLHKKLYLIFNRCNTKYISFFSGRYGWKKETHKYDKIFPLSDITFEGKKYFAPANSDYFLKQLYGNYMELPPVEAQINHNPKYILFEADA